MRIQTDTLQAAGFICLSGLWSVFQRWFSFPVRSENVPSEDIDEHQEKIERVGSAIPECCVFSRLHWSNSHRLCATACNYLCFPFFFFLTRFVFQKARGHKGASATWSITRRVPSFGYFQIYITRERNIGKIIGSRILSLQRENLNGPLRILSVSLLSVTLDLLQRVWHPQRKQPSIKTSVQLQQPWQLRGDPQQTLNSVLDREVMSSSVGIMCTNIPVLA